jgi:hypothetical protein
LKPAVRVITDWKRPERRRVGHGRSRIDRPHSSARKPAVPTTMSSAVISSTTRECRLSLGGRSPRARVRTQRRSSSWTGKPRPPRTTSADTIPQIDAEPTYGTRPSAKSENPALQNALTAWNTATQRGSRPESGVSPAGEAPKSGCSWKLR